MLKFEKLFISTPYTGMIKAFQNFVVPFKINLTLIWVPLFFCGFVSFAQGTFSLDGNGVTIICSGCVAGNTGNVGGQTYTAHDNTSLAAKSKSDTDWDRVVTSPVTNMYQLFKDETTFN
ncbi:MAG: hypothetical protein P8O94_04260, partial [Flavobacteriaceae bacterium]|nr:hypothetical protein [Flavobacteriaceae bacterium]